MNKSVLVIVSIALIAIALIIGFSVGKMQGERNSKTNAGIEYSRIINAIFPEPTEPLHRVSGILQKKVGAALTIEIISPADYLPHPDGSPRATEIRTAMLSVKTTAVLKDFSSLDKNGNPRVSEVKITDLKIGDSITVQSDADIRTAQKFDVTSIELVQY